MHCEKEEIKVDSNGLERLHKELRRIQMDGQEKARPQGAENEP